MLQLVRELIGVIPNCDPFLEIWPTGFRTYNLLVPNLLNLPFSMFGFGVDKAILGLAMYTSSRAASCAYCSAHTCSFALRRGASTESLVGHRTPHEEIVATVAEGMSQIPFSLTTSECIELAKYFSSSDIEWIILSAGMMGFLNKFMDAVGVELEAKSIAEVSSLLVPTGWMPGKHLRTDAVLSPVSMLPKTDNLSTYLRVIRQVPSAIQIENRWTADVPDRWPDVGEYLETRTGYGFPLLSKLSHRRAIRAIATVLRDNLDPSQSEIGLAAKCLAAFVYATVVANEAQIAMARLLAGSWAPELDESIFAAVAKFSAKPVGDDVTAIAQSIVDLSALSVLSEQDVATIVLARAASTSPAEINPAILSEVTPRLTSASIVELIVWLSVQQLMHRIGCFYAVADSN